MERLKYLKDKRDALFQEYYNKHITKERYLELLKPLDTEIDKLEMQNFNRSSYCQTLALLMKLSK